LAKYIYETIGILESKNPFRAIFRTRIVPLFIVVLTLWLGRHPISSGKAISRDFVDLHLPENAEAIRKFLDHETQVFAKI